MSLLRLAPLATAALLCSCAAVPDITLHYYPASWEAEVVATRLIWCDETMSGLIVGPVSAAVTPVYFRDPEVTSPQKLELKALDRWYADMDLKLTLTQDGRLRAVNQSATGSGEATLKAFAGLAGTFKAASATKSTPGIGPLGPRIVPAPTNACKLIAKLGTAKQVLAVSYEGRFSRAQAQPKGGYLLKMAESYDQALASHLPELRARVELADIASPSLGAADGELVLKLQKVQVATVNIEEATAKPATDSDWKLADKLTLPVPSRATYDLPIPKAALFGKVNLSLELADSGAVTSIGYGRTAGAAGAANAINDIAKLDSASARLTQLKTELDLLSVQTKLARCRADPDNC